MSRSYRTGPKGVINDYNEDLRRRKIENEIENEKMVLSMLRYNSVSASGYNEGSDAFVIELNEENFVDIVENSVCHLVVVLLYELYIPGCRYMHGLFTECAPLAKNEILFCCTTTKMGIDEVALPVVILYQRGEEVETIVRIHEALPNKDGVPVCSPEEFIRFINQFGKRDTR